MKILTSEVVFPGHPDKICDQISEAILDECLRQDINSRVAVEVMIKDNLIVIGGEITTKAKINYKKVVAKVLKHIGLKEKFKVLVKVSKQSPDIAQGVDGDSSGGEYLGAGDQGVCIKEGTLIATSEGYIPIEEVKCGDLVLTSSGKYEKVYNACKTGFLKTIKLVTNFGRELVCTPEHKIFTEEKGFVNATETLNLTLNTNCTNVFGNTKYTQTLTQESVNPHGGKAAFLNRTFTLDKDIAYLIGCLIGDGDVSTYKNITLTAIIKDKRDVYQTILEKIFSDKIMITPTSFTICSKGFRDFLYSLGLDYWKSDTKQIPQAILKSNKDIQIAFLQGLFDSDGGIAKNKHHSWYKGVISYSSISRELISQISLLLRNLGINCVESLHTKQGSKSSSGIPYKHNCYIVKLDKYRDTEKFNEIIGFRVKYKKDKLEYCLNNHKPSYYKTKLETVISIEPCDDYDVYDLSVENSPEFYANGILVHNCYGYANSEGDNLPLPYRYAKEIAWSMIELQHDLPDIFGVDGKCQVSIKYDDNNKPVHITTIVVSQQTRKGIKREAYYPIIKQAILRLFECIDLLDEDTRILINPTGKFEVGGSYADCGVTGRKIACDLYGGLGRTQGGNLNGKDLSKVDKLGAYFTRLVALAFVQAELAKECEVQVAYAIGEDAPVAVYVTSLNTGVYSDDVLTQAAREFFDFTPMGMKNTLFPKDTLKNRVSDTLNEVGYFEYFAAHGHTGFRTPGDYAIRNMPLGRLVEIAKAIAGDYVKSDYEHSNFEEWGTPMIPPDIDSGNIPTLTYEDLPYVESKGRGRPKGRKDSKKRKSRKKTTK